MKQKRVFATIFIFVLCAAGIIAIAFWPADVGWPFTEKKTREQHRTRIIVPNATDSAEGDPAWNENASLEDSYNLKAPLGDDEIAISVLTIDFDRDTIEEQLVAFRSLSDAERPVSIAFIGYDEYTKKYRYLWNTQAAATMPGTVSLYTQDLLGDRSFCVVLTGMNGEGDYTMTIFRKDPRQDISRPFVKIAELTMDGSIVVQETERPQAYQQGTALGQPFTITAWGRDTESDNITDRIEISYAYNPVRGIYEQSKTTRVPGAQIEQRRLKEILSGEAKDFEEFINDLWFHVDSEGSINKNQYLYFDPLKREIIFFGDDTEQIFIWQSSVSRYYGLFIISRNISVMTLRRTLEVELVSLDRMRMKVNEDVNLRIGVTTSSWDGLYQRAGIHTNAEAEQPVSTYTSAVYDSSMGRLRFHDNGEYELSASGTLTKGRYAFFKVGGNDLLELRPDKSGASGGNQGNARSGSGESRLIYNITSMESPDNLSLSRVRLGAAGIRELHEAPIILTKTQ